jgi:hypothetical protein
MAVGFGVAAILIVGALFQEQVAAVTRWVGRRGRATMAVLSRRAMRGAGGAAVGAGSAAAGAGRRAAGMVRAIRARPIRSAAGARPGAEPTPEELEEVPDDDWPRPEPAAASIDREWEEPTTARSAPKESGREEVVGDRRMYLPLSSVAVAEKARSFLEQRGGAASASALVQHLDGLFGRGRGVALLEALRTRGEVGLRRDPKMPTRIDAFLPESAQGGPTDEVGGTGSGRRSP